MNARHSLSGVHVSLFAPESAGVGGALPATVHHISKLCSNGLLCWLRSASEGAHLALTGHTHIHTHVHSPVVCSFWQSRSTATSHIKSTRWPCDMDATISGAVDFGLYIIFDFLLVKNYDELLCFLSTV